MSRSSHTCENCFQMIQRSDLLEKACSPAGLDVTQTVEEFLQALKLGCHICLIIRRNSDHERKYKPNNEFCLLQEGVSLYKNVKCRKSGDNEDPVTGSELPKDYHFDRMVMAIGSVDTLEDLYFDVEALDDDPAAKWVSARPLDPDVIRPEAIKSAKQWLSNCVNHHQQCMAMNNTAARSKTSPKRLIRIEKDLDGHLKVNLFLCSKRARQPYAALSYCWGAIQTNTLTEANVETWCTEISVPSLPQTIQDAIVVVNKLGLKYLWVDALCIIQDCSTDKGEEISVMELIYQQAELTICASSPAACTEGFLHKRSFGEEPMPTLNYSALQFACPPGETGMVLVKESQTYYVTQEPLYKRAWTLQEQMLSSRTLVYSSCQVWWECFEVKGCDRGKPYSIRTDGGTIGSLPCNGLMKRVERAYRDSNHDHEYLWRAWKGIVNDYSSRELSDATDKLLALSGLASKFSELWNCTYYAGLWERRLLEGLNWSLYEPPSWKPDKYIAPSWSWASAVGYIDWDDKAYDTQADQSPAEYTKIFDCRVTVASETVPFGQVTDGSLMIEGLAQWIDWDGQEQIESKDLSPDSRPIKSSRLGDPLYPEGIVALAKPDYDQIGLCSPGQGTDFDAVTPDSFTVTFWMGRVVQAENNEALMRILLLVISRTSALMLYTVDDDVYERCGLLNFRSEIHLQSYFEGSDVKRAVIR